MRLVKLAFPALLVITLALAPQARAQTYTTGDTLTVIQKPLLNIPALVRPGDPLPISCVADPTTTGWQATLVRGNLDIPLTVTGATYDATTLWWTLACTTPDVPLYELYNLRVTADGGVDDTSNHAVKVIPAFRDEFTIVHITDTHLPTYLYYDDNGAATDSTTSMNLRVITQDINLINPEFVVLTGDLINEGELEDFLDAKYYSRAQMHLNEFAVPVFLTAGNHDIGGWSSTPPSDGTARRDWWRFFGWQRLNDPPSGAPAHTQDYSFDYGTIHFTALEAYNNYDNWRPEIYGSDSFTADQLAWLDADLAAAAGSARRVIFHHRDFQDQLNLGALGIDLSLSGHIHSDIDDTSYPLDVSTDNAGGQNRPFRLVRFSGANIDPRPTLSADDAGLLAVSYVPNNSGAAEVVTATVHNEYAEAFPRGLLRVNMPAGAAGYVVTGGALAQVDDTGDFAVCYVDVAIPALGDISVTVSVDNTAGSDTPAIGGAWLLGAHPNPFNPRTEISFELDQDTSCRLTIFDVRGQVVAVLVDGMRAAGQQSVTWDGRDAAGRALSSGTYLVSLRAGSYNEARKMTLAR